MVLPRRDRAWRAVEELEAHAHQASVSALDRGIAARPVHEVRVLVVPDRQRRPLPEDEAVDGARLGFGQRARAGVIGPAGQRPPAVGEVAVEVDAVGVLARVGGAAVGVELVHQPEGHAARSGGTAECPGHSLARGLVPVDAADDQDLGGR